MVDPISVTSLAIQIGDVIWRVYEYGKEVKEWKAEVRALCEELCALKGVLEHMQQRYEFSQNNDDPKDGTVKFMESTEFFDMIRSTTEFLDGLLSRLTIPKDKIRRAVKALAWPLNKSDILVDTERLGRVKAWFVMTMMSDNLDLSKDTYLEVRELKTLLYREHESRNLERQEKTRKELIDWLAPVNPSAPHTKAFSRWQVGTGLWFVDGFFEQWFHSKQATILWLRGKSGAGKTTLFSSITEYALRRTRLTERASVLFFYCSFDNAASQDPVNLLASLVAQLAEKAPSVLDAYQARYLSPDRPNIQELEDQIVDHSSTLERLYIFVDAVNESAAHIRIINSLLRIVQMARNVAVFLTSTPDNETSDILQDRMIAADMRPQWIEDDIRLFVNVNIQQIPTLRNLSEKIKLDIQQAVVEKADGMFRWVQCQMDFLAAQRTGKAVRKALEQLPDDLNSVYTRILNSILPADQAIAKQAFTWLSFSKRPLSLLELCEAVVIDEEDCTIDEDYRLQPPTILLSVCKGLIVHDEDSDQVALAHSSIKAFLTSTRIGETEASFFAFDHQGATQKIIRTCLTYLMFDDFRGGCCDRKMLHDRIERYYLLKYAALYWAVHASQRSEPVYLIDEDDLVLITKFLSTYNSYSSTGGNFTHWVLCLIEDVEDKAIRATEPLYYMCSFGLTSIVDRLIRNSTDLNIDSRGGRAFSTALQVSCVRNYIDIVDLLLEHGADPNSRNVDRLSCLFWAETYQRKEVYDLLRQHGAKPNHNSEPDFDHRKLLLRARFLSTYRDLENEYRLGATLGTRKLGDEVPEGEVAPNLVTLPFYSRQTRLKKDDELERNRCSWPTDLAEMEGPFELPA